MCIVLTSKLEGVNEWMCAIEGIGVPYLPLEDLVCGNVPSRAIFSVNRSLFRGTHRGPGRLLWDTPTIYGNLADAAESMRAGNKNSITRMFYEILSDRILLYRISSPRVVGSGFFEPKWWSLDVPHHTGAASETAQVLPS